MPKLSNRLQTCADLVRDKSRLADIGCDHGLLPVYLAEKNKIISATAADINEKPLLSCEKLVKSRKLENKIKCVISNGLENVKEEETDDILVAGMGGELIARILSDCAWVKKKHLILNPMTHSEIVRKWLYDNGFSIKNDLITAEGRHHYNVLDAYYTGDFTEYDTAKCFLGEIKDFSDKDYFIHLLNYLKNRQNGGANYRKVISIIEEKINDKN